ncbi:hypothetical protein CPB84DRAFT_1777603 [Gymnopilus junonius]|uniref:Uncharacterized protein n=1 Tax=Gymnopilus junonius TaxID=109634 RepID=A0A9P5NNI9_GYMJU|nr:hypothetical protein CPB84DRAFT_1777603 [Gymnopilus junonius]
MAHHFIDYMSKLDKHALPIDSAKLEHTAHPIGGYILKEPEPSKHYGLPIFCQCGWENAPVEPQANDSANQAEDPSTLDAGNDQQDQDTTAILGIGKPLNQEKSKKHVQIAMRLHVCYTYTTIYRKPKPVSRGTKRVLRVAHPPLVSSSTCIRRPCRSI